MPACGITISAAYSSYPNDWCRTLLCFECFFGLLRHPSKLPTVVADVYDLMRNNQMLFGVYEGLSFEAFRRVATMISVPAEGSRGLVTQRFSIGSVDLADAQRIDANASDG